MAHFSATANFREFSEPAPQFPSPLLIGNPLNKEWRKVQVAYIQTCPPSHPCWHFSSCVLLCRLALTNSTPRLEYCQHKRDEQSGRRNDRREDQVAHHERGWFASYEPPALLGRPSHLWLQRDRDQCGEQNVQHQLDGHLPVATRSVRRVLHIQIHRRLYTKVCSYQAVAFEMPAPEWLK